MNNTLQQLFHLLDNCPTSWHAVSHMSQQLEQAGYKQIDASATSADLQDGQGYYITREGSVMAFVYGSAIDSLRIIGCHTDSPNLRLHLDSDTYASGVRCIGVSSYGGVLLRPWFDRSLGIAGQVTLKGQDQPRLVRIDDVGTVPNLAIHLNRSANGKDQEVNIHKQMRFVYSCDEQSSLRGLLAEHLDVQASDIIEVDLALFDGQNASLVGSGNELIQSARLDNLLSCSAGLQVMTRAKPLPGTVLAAFDHEEIGSHTRAGAAGNFLNNVLDLMGITPEQKARSLALSVDNAHAQHPAPEYADKHEAHHATKLNRGVVLKVDVNQRYAGEIVARSQVQALASAAQIPLQRAITRPDLVCGSTIGPISSTVTGIKHVDIGVPQWAMHSIRETAGSSDYQDLVKLLTCFVQ